jgi:hypothetical protein
MSIKEEIAMKIEHIDLPSSGPSEHKTFWLAPQIENLAVVVSSHYKGDDERIVLTLADIEAIRTVLLSTAAGANQTV